VGPLDYVVNEKSRPVFPRETPLPTKYERRRKKLDEIKALNSLLKGE